MKYVIISLCFVLSLLVGNLIGVSTYDYFYDLKMKECEAIQGSEYEVSTEDVSYCYKIQVNKLWQYDIGYYIGINIIIVLLFFMIFLLVSMSEMARDFGRL